MTEEYEVKACPFCGEAKKVMAVIETESDSEGTWQVHCFGCKANGPMSADLQVSISRWNFVAQTRAEREEENEQK